MKSILHYTMMLAAVALLASCEKNPADDNDPTPTEPATLEINENLVQANAKGGEYEFTYTLTNGKVSDLTTECEAEWIHDFDLSIEGTVLFTIDPNTTTESRIVNIYLKHGKVSDKIVVSQTGMSPNDIEYSFDMKYDINGPYVRMSVTPDPETTRYYAWYYSKKGMEKALAQSPGVDIVMYLNRLVEVEMSNAIYYGAYAGYTTEESIAQLTMVGPAYQDFELNGETEFYGFACAVDKVGNRLSDVVYNEFKTGPVAPSANDIKINIDDINSDRISYSVTTTNDDQYAVMVYTAAEIEGKSDEDIIVMFNETNSYVNYLRRGNCSGTALVSHDDADYYVIAFGFEYGMATTDVKREKVHTLKSDPSQTPEFSFNIDKVTHFRIKATIEADPKTCLYYADYCLVDDNAEDLLAMVHEAAQWYVDNGYFTNLAACYKFMGTKGKKQFEFDNLEPESQYRLFAVGINEVTGEFNTDVIFTDVITTPAKKVSESYIEIPIGKYFDGYDLKDAYPTEFNDADGWAVIPLEVTTHGDVESYYYDVYLGNVMDTTYPTDDEIILDLQMYGLSNKPLSMSYCYFYEQLTLIYFSRDTDDNNSPVTRKLFTMTPEGCSPIEEFEYGAELQSLVYKCSRELKN